MPNVETMMCPAGHGPMNCHAEKPIEPTTAEEAQAYEAGAGFVEQVHECPQCGSVNSRRVAG